MNNLRKPQLKPRAKKESLFEPKPRGKGWPFTCNATHLLAFSNEKELEAWHQKMGGRGSIKKYLCWSCKQYHYEWTAPPKHH